MDFAAPPPSRVHERPWPIARIGARSRADALAVATRIARDTDASLAGTDAYARPLVRGEAYDSRAVPLLAAAAALMFAVLCLNVAALRMVQLGQRRRDVGVSLALGAPRRLVLGQAALDGLVVGA